MPYMRRTTIAGRTVKIEKYFSIRQPGKHGTRRPHSEETSDEKKEINRQRSIEKLRNVLNCNFCDGDWHVAFTYQRKNRPKTREEARKNYDDLMKALKKEYKKAGKEFFYVAVTEYENVSIHHHVILPNIDVKILQRCWRFSERGQVRLTPLNTDGEYIKLAEYLIKETDKTAKKLGGMYRKRWNASKGMKKPEIIIEVVKADSFKTYPKARKGFYIKKDSLRTSVDAFGLPRQSYVMIQCNRRC